MLLQSLEEIHSLRGWNVEPPQFVLILAVRRKCIIVTRIAMLAIAMYRADGVLALLLKVSAVPSDIGTKTSNLRLIASSVFLSRCVLAESVN